MPIYLGSNNGYRTQRHTIPAESVYTVDFEGCNPNYYRLMNTGNVTLFCATKSLPTTDNYNFKANPISVANFCEPVTRDKLYILNNTKEDVKVILTTWEGEFNPTFMAVSEISLNNEGTIKTDGMINGFTVPLPSGENTIGKVGLDEEALKTISESGGSEETLNKLTEFFNWLSLVNEDYKQAISDDSGYIKSLGDVIYTIFEDLGILSYSLQNEETLSGNPSIYGMLNKLADHLCVNNFKDVKENSGDSIGDIVWYISEGISFIKTALDGSEGADTENNILSYLWTVIQSLKASDDPFETYDNPTIANMLYWVQESVSLIHHALQCDYLADDDAHPSLYGVIRKNLEQSTTEIYNSETGDMTEITTLRGLLEDYTDKVISKLSNIQTSLRPGANVDELTQITTWNSDGTYPVVGTAWSYVGEIVTNLSDDKLKVAWCVSNGTNITNEYTVEEWNKVCHILRCGSVTFKTSDTTIKPFIALINK